MQNSGQSVKKCDVKMFDKFESCTICACVVTFINIFNFSIFKAVTTTGEKIMDVELTDHNCSEVLRIFIKARNCKDNEVQITVNCFWLL